MIALRYVRASLSPLLCAAFFSVHVVPCGDDAVASEDTTVACPCVAVVDAPPSDNVPVSSHHCAVCSCSGHGIVFAPATLAYTARIVVSSYLTLPVNTTDGFPSSSIKPPRA